MPEIVCGSLSSPDNGNVIVSGTGVGAQAMYICDPGYVLVGETVRTCQNLNEPEWSGDAPFCNSKYIASQFFPLRQPIVLILICIKLVALPVRIGAW